MLLKTCSVALRCNLASIQLITTFPLRNVHTSCVLMKTVRIADLPPKREPIHVYMRKGPGPRGDPRKRLKRIDPDLLFQGIHNVPFNPEKGYLVSPKEVHPSKWGGNLEIMERIGRDTARYGHPPGYYDKQGKFVLVPEMIPEFVVPDLSDCELRPYVNYALEDGGEEALTPVELFKATYGAEILAMRGDMTPKDLDMFLDWFIDEHSKMTDEQEPELGDTREHAAHEQSTATT